MTNEQIRTFISNYKNLDDSEAIDLLYDTLGDLLLPAGYGSEIPISALERLLASTQVKDLSEEKMTELLTVTLPLRKNLNRKVLYKMACLELGFRGYVDPNEFFFGLSCD